MHMLNPETAAHYVLRHYGEPGSWIRPGGFYEKLIEAAAHADPENLTKIGLGFPNVASAVAVYKSRGPKPLVEIANDLVRHL